MITLALVVLILAAVALVVEAITKRAPYVSIALVIVFLLLTQFGR